MLMKRTCQRYSYLGTFMLAVLLMVGHVNVARADGSWLDCNRVNGYYQFFESITVEVGKDAQVGDMLGGWVSSNNAQAWSCVAKGNYNGLQFTTQGYPPYRTIGTVQTDGGTYSIYYLFKRGLGYIVRWRFTVNGKTTDWEPLNIIQAGQQQHPGAMVIPYNNGEKFYVGVDVQVRFVKTESSIATGSVSVFDPIYIRHVEMYGGNIFEGGLTYMIAQLQQGAATIHSASGTCTTPDVTVKLPVANSSEFKGIGSTAARKEFDLAFNQCPPGLGSIGYSFAATTSVLDAANGVVAPSSGANARGVGIQLLDSKMTPIIFNKQYALDAYDPSLAKANSNYKVPLTAGLYQTAEKITSGDVKTAITFTMNYK